MDSKPNLPKPLARVFLVCRRILNDGGPEYLIDMPITDITITSPFPATILVGLWGKVTGHGTYTLSVNVRDMSGAFVYAYTIENPLRLTDPLQPHHIALTRQRLQFPAPGKYDIVLLADNEEIAVDTIIVKPG